MIPNFTCLRTLVRVLVAFVETTELLHHHVDLPPVRTLRLASRHLQCRLDGLAHKLLVDFQVLVAYDNGSKSAVN